MFFNHHICKQAFGWYSFNENKSDIFNCDNASFRVEYPNEIQIQIKNVVKKLLVKVAKNNKRSNSRLSVKANDFIEYGFNKLSNIKSKHMKNYYYKSLKLKIEKSNGYYDFKNEIQIIANGMEFIVNLLYPIACLLFDRLGNCYQSPGYSIADCDRCITFNHYAASLCTDANLKTLISKLQISLPGYDSKIPKIVLEYREGTYDEKLKKYVQDNIDSFEEYPCLNEFREFLELEIFSKDHFSIDKPNNSFTLRNCWMIQGLGTLKLLSDINLGKVLEGFELTQFKSFEEADDREQFYKRIQKDSFEESGVKAKLFEYFIELKRVMQYMSKEELENKLKNQINQDEINKELENCKLYKLKNISTFIAYNAIKYFYYVICKKGRDQSGFDVSNYELEEIDRELTIKLGIDQAYKIIHSRSYSDVLFSVAETYNYYYYNQLEQNLTIIYKRLKLKSEIEDNSNKYAKITSKFFLPGFLPVFASIPDSFIEVFEDDYINMRENTFGCVKGSLIANQKLLTKDFKMGILSNNNFEYLKQTLSIIPKAFEVIAKENSA